MIGEYLIKLLQDEAIGSDYFLNFQPEKPDDCITVYDETAPVLNSSHYFDNDHFGIQVLVRSIDSITARDLLMEIHKFISGYGGEKMSVDSPLIIDSQIVTTPAPIGTDPKNRFEYSGHYAFMVKSDNNSYRR
jgi:hypothetical protein